MKIKINRFNLVFHRRFNFYITFAEAEQLFPKTTF